MTALLAAPDFAATADEARRKFGWSYGELARRAGLSKATVYAALTAPGRDVSLDRAKKIAAALQAGMCSTT